MDDGPRVLVPVAAGSEEIETVAIVDTLRRAGARVVLAARGGGEVAASRGVRLAADRDLAGCLTEDWDLIALPGGRPGAERLAADEPLLGLLRRHLAAGRPLGAICAAPALVLAPAGLLAGRRATCHPDFGDRLPGGPAPGRVIRDGPLVTSRGPGTAIEFALALVAMLAGRERARAIAEAMVVTAEQMP